MKSILRVSALVCFVLMGNILFAQTSVNNEFTPKGLETLTDANFSFFTGEEDNVYYVDFESVSFNISDIVIKNEAGEIVLEDSVFDLPVDTIYELDFSQYGKGTYQVELKSYTSHLVKKEVMVK